MMCGAVLLLLVPALVFFAALWKTAFQLPLADDYDAILSFINVVRQTPSLPAKLVYAVTVEHNGYKLIFENAVTLIQYALRGQVYFLPLVALGDSFALFIFLVTCSLSQVSPGDVARRLLLLAPVAFLVFQLQYASALNFASCSLQQLPVIFFSFLSVLLLTRFTRLSLVGSCLALVLAIASSPNGFFVVPVGFILLAQMRRWRQMPSWLCVAAVMVGVYAFRYHHMISEKLPAGSTPGRSHINIVYAFSFLGSSAARYLSIGPSLTLGLALVALFCLAAGRRYFTRNPAIFYCMLFIIINSIAVSGLRSDQGLAQSLASRYRMYSNLLLALSYMYLLEDLLPLVKSVTVRRAFLVAALIFSAAFCALSDIAGARFLAEKKDAVTMEFAAQWRSPPAGTAASNESASPALAKQNPAFARQLDAGVFDPDLGVLRESVRLGVYTPPTRP